MEIPNFISLIGRKCYWPEQAILIGGHIIGESVLVLVQTLRIFWAWLGDEGLHLHITGSHESTRHSVEIDTLISLVDVICF